MASAHAAEHHVAALCAKAEALLAAGRAGDARDVLEQAEVQAPERAATQRLLAMAYRALGLSTASTAADAAALALDARSALALYNLATVFFMAEQYGPAEKWYRRALAFDADLVVANQNLAAILEIQGKLEEARGYRDRALGRQNLFVETSPSAVRTVLILAASAFGNVPIDDLLSAKTNNRLKWFVEYARPGQAEQLPPHDLVFNAIGDADLAGPCLATLTRFVQRCRRPLLNPPDKVERTQRHLLPDLLAGLPRVVVPPVLRLSRAALAADDLPARLTDAGLAPPCLLRPLGSHGGKGVSLIDDVGQLARVDAADSDTVYLTAFVDYRAADGFFRKYRMVFVDRRPYPCHLAISPHWLVHYFSADMLAEPWKRDEERCFLEDPGASLGASAMAAVAAIGQRLDLDFAGVDFSVLPDGRVLVFEANATMLVHLHDKIEDFPYKHIHVPRIFRAFEAMLAERTALSRVGAPCRGSDPEPRPEDR
jgi:tetratricopeptide (TPR) repeat protein